ncbi:DNA polymerase III subunit delta' [Microbaculum marinisediminis]|uniref:DNA polymerase III subunit delta n=1 Tax=Microbaculum marinisediminis TaxID=2931392 RepID=A0AAW5R5G3_9HYPH|nr:DNA polymerase III subunit delta' [Microbaculum sp. A6E488]MCT8974153.1 DNA polymerase III subunit delta' [Microbaculum sp. A6E488]
MTATIPPDFSISPPEAAACLIGHDDAEAALLSAYKSGRLHHAWLVDGPEGVGKATLAYRFARFLLGHPDHGEDAVQAARDLTVPADDPAARQIRARSHPDLIVLQRPRDEEGRATATVISVDQVRKVARFLSTTSATGGWRVVIVDTADDFNRSSANALLKMLEEPPQRAVFLLLSGSPGRLLPTIRSRCRRLALKPLDTATVAEALRIAGVGQDDDARATAAALCGGSLGKAMDLATQEAVETIHAVNKLLADMPRHDPVAAQKLAEALGRRGAEDRYRMATSLLTDAIAGRMRKAARAGAQPHVLAPWAEVWEKVTQALAEAERLNLDRTLTLLSVFRIVSTATSLDAARV